MVADVMFAVYGGSVEERVRHQLSPFLQWCLSRVLFPTCPPCSLMCSHLWCHCHHPAGDWPQPGMGVPGHGHHHRLCCVSPGSVHHMEKVLRCGSRHLIPGKAVLFNNKLQAKILKVYHAVWVGQLRQQCLLCAAATKAAGLACNDSACPRPRSSHSACRPFLRFTQTPCACSAVVCCRSGCPVLSSPGWSPLLP